MEADHTLKNKSLADVQPSAEPGVLIPTLRPVVLSPPKKNISCVDINCVQTTNI